MPHLKSLRAEPSEKKNKKPIEGLQRSMSLESVPQRFFECRDGVSLAYLLFPRSKQAEPDATPLVMINGLSGVKEEFVPLAHIFSHFRDVVVFDNRGVGGSYRSSKQKQNNWNDYSVSVIDLIEHLGWKGRAPILLGHSMGGMIAQNVVCDYPSYISGLVLLATMHGPESVEKHPPEINLRLFREFTTVTRPKDEMLTVMMEWNVTKPWRQAHVAQFETLVKESATRLRPLKGIAMQMAALSENQGAPLNKVTIPTLIIHGDSDRIIHVDCARELARKIRGAELLILKDQGHTPFWMGGTGALTRAVNTLCQKVDERQRNTKSRL